MRLAHTLFDTPIEFCEGRINVLVVENKKTFANVVYELINMCGGMGGGFVLSDDEKDVTFACVDIVSDVFSLDVNTRKNIGKLIAELEKTAMDEVFYEESCRMMSEVTSYAMRVAEELEYNVDISEIKIQDIFKICEAKFGFEADSICGALNDYMKISHDIAKIRLFVFVNLRQMIDDEDVVLLYKNILYNKYNVLLIESSDTSLHLPEEKYKIIDKDLCEIA